MEFIVNTVEDMLIKVNDTSKQITTLDTATAVYDIYHDDEPLIPINAVVQNAVPTSILNNVFRCSIAPILAWGGNGKFALYLHMTNIPGRPETPRLGPFRFGVVT